MRYGKLVAKGWAANEQPSEAAEGKWYQNTAVNLLDRLDADRDDVLRFTTDFNVEFTNNQGERDIRMVKLQQKISGSWRTKAGADHFCAIRSYVSTMKKHGYDVLDRPTSAVRRQGLAPWRDLNSYEKLSRHFGPYFEVR